MGPLSHYIHIHLYIHFSHWHLTLFTLLIHTDIFYTLTFDPPLHFWLTQRYLSHIDPSLHFWFTQRYLSHIDIWPSLHYWFTQIFFTHWHLTLFTLLIYRDIFYTVTFDPLYTTDSNRYFLHVDIWPSLHNWFIQTFFFTHHHVYLYNYYVNIYILFIASLVLCWFVNRIKIMKNNVFLA